MKKSEPFYSDGILLIHIFCEEWKKQEEKQTAQWEQISSDTKLLIQPLERKEKVVLIEKDQVLFLCFLFVFFY